MACLGNRYHRDYSFFSFFSLFPVMCSSQHDLAYLMLFPAARAVHFTFRFKVLNVLPQTGTFRHRHHLHVHEQLQVRAYNWRAEKLYITSGCTVTDLLKS